MPYSSWTGKMSHVQTQEASWCSLVTEVKNERVIAAKVNLTDMWNTTSLLLEPEHSDRSVKVWSPLKELNY